MEADDARFRAETIDRRNRAYHKAFTTLQAMLTGHKPPNLLNAVFAVENAFYDGRLDYSRFVQQIDTLKALCQLLQLQSPAPISPAARNALVYQALYHPPASGKFARSPMRYDFVDYRGDTSYAQQFVSKLLNTRTGQCHSMSLLYLILAHEIGAKAWLALAPNHSYIIHTDAGGQFYHFET